MPKLVALIKIEYDTNPEDYLPITNPREMVKVDIDQDAALILSADWTIISAEVTDD